jgi:hypothetical protein
MMQCDMRCVTGLVIMFAMLGTAGCDRAPAESAAEPANQEAEAAAGSSDYAGVVLNEASAQRLGVEVVAVTASRSLEVTSGTAIVLDSAALTAVLADIDAVRADATATRASYQRLQDLYADDGNASRQAVEAAQAVWMTARTRLISVEARARSEWGAQFASAQGSRPSWLTDLADGRAALLRAEFVGQLPADAARLDYSLLGNGSEEAAPQTLAYVGRSRAQMLATVGASVLLRARGATGSESVLRPGERLAVIASSQAGSQRALVPAAAAFVDGGQFWCYVQRAAGRFDRVPLASAKRVAEGYPVAIGINAGDKVVVRGALLLLSLERGSGRVADEE